MNDDELRRFLIDNRAKVRAILLTTAEAQLMQLLVGSTHDRPVLVSSLVEEFGRERAQVVAVLSCLCAKGYVERRKTRLPGVRPRYVYWCTV